MNATDHDDNRSPSGSYLAAESGLAQAYCKLMRLGVDENVSRSKCIAALKEVATIHQKYNFLEEYADGQLSIAQIYYDAAIAARKRSDFSENMRKAISALKLASAQYSELHKWARYAGTQHNLAVYYELLFRNNIDGPANLREMRRTVEDGIEVFQKYGLKDEEERFKKLLELINKEEVALKRL